MQPAFLGKGLAPVPQGVDRGFEPLCINGLGSFTDPYRWAQPWPCRRK